LPVSTGGCSHPHFCSPSRLAMAASSVCCCRMPHLPCMRFPFRRRTLQGHAYPCKLPFCDECFHTAAARNKHTWTSADHAPFRFHPLDAPQMDETDVAGVVASTVDLLIRSVEYGAAATQKRASTRCVGCGRVCGVCGCELACV